MKMVNKVGIVNLIFFILLLSVLFAAGIYVFFEYIFISEELRFKVEEVNPPA